MCVTFLISFILKAKHHAQYVIHYAVENDECIFIIQKHILKIKIEDVYMQLYVKIRM